MIARARGLGAYTPIQQQIIDAAHSLGVDPATALAIARQESNFNPAARSAAGAVGLFQLMPATAASVGVDPGCIANPGEPACTSENITGGLTYFKSLLDRYGGDVSTALWAYNAGPGNVAKGNLPLETASYIPAVLGYQATFADASGELSAAAGGGPGDQPPPAGAPTDYTSLYIGGGLVAAALVLALVV
jgi:soluble lytic murein transglycosylase-like protein